MFKKALTLAAIVLLFSCQGGQEKKATFQYQGNPLFQDAFTANPAPMVSSDGRLYVFCSHDEQYDDKPGYIGENGFNTTEWLCYSTADMKSWTPLGAVLKPSDFSWATGEAGPAQCVEADGKYYLYVSTRSLTRSSIGVAVADRPEGPYKDALGKPLILNGTEPSVMIDDDGTPWMSWKGNGGQCFMIRLKKSMTELEKDSYTFQPENFHGGPWLFKHKGVYYVAYTSMGAGRQNLSYAVANSLRGPWESKGELSGMAEDSFTIKAGIVEFKGKNYLFYHNGILALNGYGPSTGRRSVSVEEMFYSADGTTIMPVTQTREGVSF